MTITKPTITKVEAIVKVLEAHNGIASLATIYAEAGRHYPGVNRATDWQAGLRGVLYRELRNDHHFVRIGNGSYALKAKVPSTQPAMLPTDAS